MKTISLCMIVKNESHVIERCLNSVKPLLDYVLIVDTGSTDNTIEVIYNWLNLIIYHKFSGIVELRKYSCYFSTKMLIN
jgi:glycosyltransferase involved in cell wall biosynthesis